MADDQLVSRSDDSQSQGSSVAYCSIRATPVVPPRAPPVALFTTFYTPAYENFPSRAPTIPIFAGLVKKIRRGTHAEPSLLGLPWGRRRMKNPIAALHASNCPVSSGNLLHATLSLLFYFISPPSLSSSPNHPAPGLHAKSLTLLLWVGTRLENRLPPGLKSPPAPPQAADFTPAKRPGEHQRLELLLVFVTVIHQ